MKLTRICDIPPWRQLLSYRSCDFSPVLSKRLVSSKRWQARQRNDIYTREAAVQGLKSRAAFKLLQIDEKYRIFRSGQTVVDLGYAPGSWSQVAVSRTQPNGRVLGVDIIPAQPPKGVSTIQGNFLSPEIQQYVQEFLRDPDRGRPRPVASERPLPSSVVQDTKYLDGAQVYQPYRGEQNATIGDTESEQTVDVVLSDMMMNTSGISFRDHAGSMDLCRAALRFSFKVLKAGGHFVCKFYQGPEDKDFEKQLRDSFEKVHRIKPESSRSESREAYFVAIARKIKASSSTVSEIREA
ncbi:hypothetical protein VTN77DRAFT_9914 [Rasamsonia byssochlamydoides]|uniref:uncharacterized protein n=1 Tax=Rasamsonia byssochlamydoides TaxID=89139 RepID=UPI003742DBED